MALITAKGFELGWTMLEAGIRLLRMAGKTKEEIMAQLKTTADEVYELEPDDIPDIL
jgi:hypothetical protein